MANQNPKPGQSKETKPQEPTTQTKPQEPTAQLVPPPTQEIIQGSLKATEEVQEEEAKEEAIPEKPADTTGLYGRFKVLRGFHSEQGKTYGIGAPAGMYVDSLSNLEKHGKDKFQLVEKFAKS